LQLSEKAEEIFKRVRKIWKGRRKRKFMEDEKYEKIYSGDGCAV
jgi:hypothetical protein